VSALADSGGQGAVVGALGGLQQVHVDRAGLVVQPFGGPPGAGVVLGPADGVRCAVEHLALIDEHIDRVEPGALAVTARGVNIDQSPSPFKSAMCSSAVGSRARPSARRRNTVDLPCLEVAPISQCFCSMPTVICSARMVTPQGSRSPEHVDLGLSQ
jgi:hypothetical protein